MDKLKINDITFSHSKLGYCSDYQISKLFEWDRTPSIDENEYIVYTDNKLGAANGNNNIAWLIEPVCISPHTYAHIINNHDKFKYVLTHEKDILDNIPNAKLQPFGCCWIEPQDQKIYHKTKNTSIIASHKMQTNGHRFRHDIIKKLTDTIDVFGNGYFPIENKLYGLKDYRYSIVVENCKRDYWFTEKLIDCFMTGTIPIYWGCPSIEKFFNKKGIISFDTLDEIVKIIGGLGIDDYETRLEAIKDNFEKSKEFLLPDDGVYKFVKSIVE